MYQKPGEAIITFPGAYHEVINTGPNLAEAVNFGKTGWEHLALWAFPVSSRHFLAVQGLYSANYICVSKH